MINIAKQNPGPFSSLLLEENLNNMRSMVLNKKLKINNMSSDIPIELINEDKKNMVNVKTPKTNKFSDINLIRDSDDDDDDESIVTAVPEDNKSESSESESKLKSKSKSKNSFPVIDNEEFQYFINSKKRKPEVKKEVVKEESSESEESEEDSDNESEESNLESDNESISSNKNSSTNPKISKRDIEKKKQEILVKLLALEKKGVTLTKKYSLKSPLEELEFELSTQQHSAEVEASVHFQQKILMAAVTGLEFLNNKFDPINAKLEGWSESVMDNIKDYEEIFIELHEKYQQKTTMPPELRLLVTLVGSGFMFHLTQTLFKSSLPGIGDVLNSNPDIMKNIMGAMGKAMNQQAGLGGISQPRQSSQPSQPSQPNNFQSSQPSQPNNFSQPSQPSQSSQPNNFSQPSQLSQSINSNYNNVNLQKSKDDFMKQNDTNITGPSINLSNLMNNYNNAPAKPIIQQAPKYKEEDESDRFSIASSSENSDRLISVTSLANKKGKKGKTIKL